MRFLSSIALGLALAAAALAQVPRPAPEFAMETANGKQWLLSQQRGKVVMIEFLLTTCPHCQQTSRVVQKLVNEYGPQGFVAVGCAINDMAKLLVPDFIRNYGLNYPVGWSLRDPVYEFLKHPYMQQLMMPTIVFVDKKGAIRAQHQGHEDFFRNEEPNLRNLITTLLREPATATKAAPARKTAPAKKTE
jgi:peroxiredoxin